VSIPDYLSQIWTQILQFIEKLVSPDWGALVGLLPLFLVLGVIGPLLSLAALIWSWYFVTKPRPKVRYEEGPRLAPLDDAGNPIFPIGEPYCLTDRTVYPSGTTRCPNDGTPLAVICPMYGIGRDAGITTCGNCGLVLKVAQRARVARSAGPPPGGAAVA
jgi:hypothetical protein